MTLAWPSEDIPDSDALYMRVHRSFLDRGELMPGAFRDQGQGMSVNWEKYCPTPEDALALARTPRDNGIISMIAGPVRAVPLGVEHTPDHERRIRSHADVVGQKTAEVRLKLLNLFEWRLRPGAPS